MAHRNQFVNTVQRRCSIGGNEPRADTKHEAPDESFRIYTPARRFLLYLRENLPDHQFIQLIREEDVHVGKTRGVKLPGRLDAQVCQVA